jgi:ABC-type phosphate transport system substrate-binding protein
VSVTASGAAANTARISGAGSTFDAPFFDLAFTRYQQQHPGVAISYSIGRQQRGHHSVQQPAD